MEPALSPRTPIKMPKEGFECPPAPPRVSKHLVIKSGDLKRFHLNLQYIYENPMSEWESALENMYYICEFTDMAEENKHGYMKDVDELVSLINAVRSSIEDFEKAQEQEDSQMDPIHTECALREELIVAIENTIQRIEMYAQVVESS